MTSVYQREAELYRLPYPRTRSVLALARPRVKQRPDKDDLWAYDCRCGRLEGYSKPRLAKLLGLDARTANRFHRDDLIDAVLAVEFGIE